MKLILLLVFSLSVANATTPVMCGWGDMRVEVIESGKFTEFEAHRGVYLTLEPDGLHWGRNKLPELEAAAYIDRLITEEKVEWVYLFLREESRIGDVVRALDVLKQTQAKRIGLFPQELTKGKTVR